MNGSFFAQCYGLVRTPYHLLSQSSHTTQQKLIFFLQFLYFCVGFMLTISLPALFFLGLQCTVQLLLPYSYAGKAFTFVLAVLTLIQVRA